MQTQTYEQIELKKTWAGEDLWRAFSKGVAVKIAFHQDRAIGIRLPESVVVEITEADGVVKNQTATSSHKPAKAVTRHAYYDPASHAGWKAHSGVDGNRGI